MWPKLVLPGPMVGVIVLSEKYRGMCVPLARVERFSGPSRYLTHLWVRDNSWRKVSMYSGF